MAVSIPESANKQPRHRLGEDPQTNKSHQIQYKGTSYTDLKTACAAFVRGDLVETGWLLDSWELEGVPGEGGLLTLNCMLASASDTGGLPKALRAVWTCKSVRNDKSILAYCGAAARRVALELWMKETDAELAEDNKYHASEDVEDTLNSQEQAIADKIRKGIDTVVRFYPVLTCKSTWNKVPSTFMENLSYIDTPGAPQADQTHAPSNLNDIISAHSWLKVQDDVEENGDGKFIRIESWMGIATVDGSWDPDLYGPQRWPMPLQTAGGSS